MGVLGLWQLLAPVGQPVTLESLENKIFAVDISIWLNQAVKGYRDSTGGSVPNAHLLSLFSRLCKLLFYKIRPIIVFDGGFPELKKQTIINRQQRRAAVKQLSKDVGLKILSNYLASQQLGQTVGTSNLKKVSFKAKEKARDEIFKLPPLPENSQSILSDSIESNDDFERKFTNFSKEDIKYLNKIDIDSDDFNELPPDVKQEILSTLKEVRKHRTWDQFEKLPKESNEFSHFQMQCLLKKRKLQSKLEEVQRDIRKINSAAYVSQYTSDHVIGETNKIMSDDTSYYVLLKKIIEYDEKEFNKNSSEDVKPTSSVMADAKDAFIRDIENIDFDEDYFSCDSKEDKADMKIKTEVVSSDDELSYNKPLEKSANKICTEVKIEKNSLNLSDEECDVDNPPPSDNINEFNKEIMFKNLESSNSKKSEQIFANDTTNKQVKCANSIQSLTQKSEIPHAIDMDLGESRCDDHQSSQLASENVVVEEEIQAAVSSNINDIIHQDKNCDLNTEHHSKGLQNVKEDKSEAFPTSVNQHISKSQNEAIVENSQNNNLFKLPNDETENSKSDLISESYNIPITVSEANLELQEELDTATAILEAERAKQDRQARTVQDHMIEECKELLHLFGIPYVVSPLEAEAQCAFYDIIDFTHGTITDDSDVWLFGGKRVFKNFFTQQKFVESYKDKEIFHHFGLSRKNLINFALLTGSDYTEGIEGVGPVTAMEIISEFPGEGIDALEKFKEWWLESNNSTKPPENKVRAKLRKFVLPQSFPDEKVFDAYLNPEVDSSMEKFTWGRPDLDALRDYTKERFGWNQSKVDDALLPILKKLNESNKQTHLDSFFTVTLKKQTNLFPSKRIMSALKKITSPQKLRAEENGGGSTSKQKSKISRKKTVSKKGIQKGSSIRGKGRPRNSKSRGPVLSEESSSDSDSSHKLQKEEGERTSVFKRKSKSSESRIVPKKVIRKTGSTRGRSSSSQGPVLSEESSSDSNS